MAAAAGAALGGLNPNPKPKQKPNPSASRPGLRSPAALADITNTGRPNPPRSVSVGDVLKENAKLVQLLAQKTKIIELSSGEINKLRFALHAARQQNLHLAQTNTQITVELNQGKERLKLLQHELACATAVLKLKGSGLELQRKSSTANNQLQKEATSQELNAAPFELAPIESDSEATSADVHHSVETQPSVPCNTVLEEALPAKTNKRTSVSRRTSKRKSESCEGTEDTNTVQPSYKPDTQPPVILHHEDQRKTLRRRSSRLNLGSCEMAEVSCETLHTDTAVPSSSTLSVPELHESNSGKDMEEATQSNTAEDELRTNALDENEMNKQPQKELNVEEEIQAADSRVAAVGDLEAHQVDDMAMDANPDQLTETQSSLPSSIKHPDPHQKRANKRVASKRKLESREGQKDSNIEEDIASKLQSTSSEPLHHEQTRKPLRRKPSRTNTVSCEVTEATLEAVQEDIVAPLPPSSSKISIEQSKAEKQNDSRSSTEPSEEQVAGRSSVEVTGRRSSMRGAAKAVSYKEIPLNVKMRRP